MSEPPLFYSEDSKLTRVLQKTKSVLPKLGIEPENPGPMLSTLPTKLSLQK